MSHPRTPDPALVTELAARKVVLNVCPGSNVKLGLYPDRASHPLDALRRAGVAFAVLGEAERDSGDLARRLLIIPADLPQSGEIQRRPARVPRSDARRLEHLFRRLPVFRVAPILADVPPHLGD